MHSGTDLNACVDALLEIVLRHPPLVTEVNVIITEIVSFSHEVIDHGHARV